MLDGAAGSWTVGETIDLTKVSGLDGGVAAELVHPRRPSCPPPSPSADPGWIASSGPGVGCPVSA